MNQLPPSKRLLLVTAMLAAVAAILASVGGAAGQSSRHAAGAKTLTIVWVGNQTVNDPFAITLVNGAKAAAKALNVKFTYRGPTQASQNFDPTAINQLLNLTKGQHPDGMLVADYPPQSLNTTIKSITASGIPVIQVNAGSATDAKATGSLTYVGNDELASGKLAGKMLAQTGAKHAVVLATPPGCQICDDRVNGFVSGFKPGKATKVVVPLTDLSDATKVKNVIIAAVTKDKSIDSAYIFGSCCHPAALAARTALGARGRSMHWGFIDMTPPIVTALKNKAVSFAIDQQPWLQGYLAVEYMAFYLRYGFTPPTIFTPAGPVVIDQQNVGRFVELSRQGIAG